MSIEEIVATILNKIETIFTWKKTGDKVELKNGYIQNQKEQKVTTVFPKDSNILPDITTRNKARLCCRNFC